METLYEGPVFDVVRRDGKDVVVHGPSVVIVAVDGERRVTLVRQQRVPAGKPVLELPAGGIEAGESALQAAQRELREETGLHGGLWEELVSFYATPGFCDERMHLFLATGLVAGEAAPDGDEDLELVTVPVEEVSELLAQLDDAKTLIGLLLLVRRWMN
jgi:ADP-ribose pyrophosphatase